MEKRILVPLDNTEISEKVIELADQWGQHLDGRLSFLHVINPNYTWGEEKTPLFEEHFESAVARVNIQSEYEVLFRVGKPYLKILEIEEELHPQLILMAAHDHSMLERLFLGSNTDYVLHRSNTSVNVYKHPNGEAENTVLVPIDYTEVSSSLVREADEWAQWHGAKLLILHVDEVPEYGGDTYMMETGFFRKADMTSVESMDLREHDHELSRLQNVLDRYVADLEPKSPYETFIRFGTPYVKILDMQKAHHPEMVMMAAHSHTMLGRMLMGSNTDYIMHHSHCPMFVFKGEQS